MIETFAVVVLLLGDSQTQGTMGKSLEKTYTEQGVKVYREASSGKGVDYFLNSLPKRQNSRTSENTLHDLLPDFVSYRQRSRIKNLARKSNYIIFGSLGGNDASRGCCVGNRRKALLKKYRKLFQTLCELDAIIIFNGSPRAPNRKHQKFDKRRALVDQIQEEASLNTCVIRNSTRNMLLSPDPDGYHYNKSGAAYAEFLMQLPGMKLPLQEMK